MQKAYKLKIFGNKGKIKKLDADTVGAINLAKEVARDLSYPQSIIIGLKR